MKRYNVLLIVGLLLCFSCILPSSKEAYLERFEKFVERVEKNHYDYKKKDWEWADKQFEKYNTEWYDKYKEELSTEELIKEKALVVRYYSLKSKKGLGKFLNDLIKDIDVDGIGENIQKYIDNKLDEDIEQIIEGATGISDSVINILEDVVDELDENLNK